MTCLKLTVMALVEFVLKEYYHGAAMEWPTVIEQRVALPVAVRTTSGRCLHQLHANPRNPALMADLALAVEELNRRQLHRGRQRQVFEILTKTTGSLRWIESFQMAGVPVRRDLDVRRVGRSQRPGASRLAFGAVRANQVSQANARQDG